MVSLSQNSKRKVNFGLLHYVHAVHCDFWVQKQNIVTHWNMTKWKVPVTVTSLDSAVNVSTSKLWCVSAKIQFLCIGLRCVCTRYTKKKANIYGKTNSDILFVFHDCQLSFHLKKGDILRILGRDFAKQKISLLKCDKGPEWKVVLENWSAVQSSRIW